jgi:CRISPR/Cas system-associated endoribonuclease Cas2
VLEISELNKLKRELRAIYIDTQTTLMRMKMESNIRQRAKMMGLQPSKTPPKRIKVINNE